MKANIDAVKGKDKWVQENRNTMTVDKLKVVATSMEMSVRVWGGGNHNNEWYREKDSRRIWANISGGEHM